MTRRRDLLKHVGGAVALTAGCLGEGTEPTDERATATTETSAPSQTPPDSRQPVGSVPSELASGALTLVDDGVPQSPIVVPTDPLASVEEAAEEFARVLEAVSDAAVEVLGHDAWRQSVDAGDRDERPVIGLGQHPLTDEAGVSAEELDQEGARIDIREDALFVVGRDDPPFDDMAWRGTYNGVIEVLKTRLGVRWIWPGELGEVLPRSDTVALDPDTWTFEHDLDLARAFRSRYYSHLINGKYQREWNFAGGSVDTEAWNRLGRDTARWARRQRVSPNLPGARKRFSTPPYGHSFMDWWERFGEDHPEWFAKPPEELGEEQPDASNRPERVKLNLPNEALQEQVFQEWLAKYEEAPEANQYLNVCPNDSPFYDTRDSTRAWDEGRNEGKSDMDIWRGRNDVVVTERYVRFFNIIAQKVADAAPEATVTSYAYNHYRPPPKVHDVRDNIVIGNVSGDEWYPDDPALFENWNGWADAGATQFWRPNLFTYLGDGTPYLYPRAIGEDLDQFREQGLRGLDIDGGINHWAVQGPTYYLVGEKVTRPDAGNDEILSEFTAAFGPAAEPVEQYLDFWESLTMETGTDEMHWLNDTVGGGPREFNVMYPVAAYSLETFEEADRLLQQAEDAVASNTISADRVAFLRTGLEHSRLTYLAMRDFFAWYGDQTSEREATAKDSMRELFEFRQGLTDTHAIENYEVTRAEAVFNMWRWQSGEGDHRVGVALDDPQPIADRAIEKANRES